MRNALTPRSTSEKGWWLTPVPLCRPRACLRRFDFAIARLGRGDERTHERARRRRHILDGAIPHFLIRLGRAIEAGELPHELQRCRANLVLGRRRLEIE